MIRTAVRARLIGLYEQSPTAVQQAARILLRVIRALAVGTISDRSMTLAAQAFTSILPVVLLLSTLPGWGALDETIEMFGIAEPVDPDSGTYASFGVIGALMTLVSATSFARALERMYVAVWRGRPLGIRGWWRWLAAVLLLAAATAAQAAVALGFSADEKGLIPSVVITFVLWTLTWYLAPRILLSTQIASRDRQILGIATGSCLTAFAIVSQIFYGAVFASARASFGVLGTVFASIGWLFVFAAIVVAVTIVVRELRFPSGA